jgi:hypothetical protein
MNRVIRNSISRLAEINRAGSLIELGKELRDERQIIVNFLKISEITESDKNGGFHFIGEEVDEMKKLYLDCFENF